DDDQARPEHRVDALAAELEPRHLHERGGDRHGGGGIDAGELKGDEKRQHRQEVGEKLHYAARILQGLYFQPPAALGAASFAGRTTRPLADTVTRYSAPSAMGT